MHQKLWVPNIIVQNCLINEHNKNSIRFSLIIKNEKYTAVNPLMQIMRNLEKDCFQMLIRIRYFKLDSRYSNC